MIKILSRRIKSGSFPKTPETLYMEGRLSGLEPKKAALKAGYSKKVAKLAETKIETQEIKMKMLDVLEQIGLNDFSLAEHLKDGLTKSVKFAGSNSNPVQVADYSVRHKYLETALKLRGELQGPSKDAGAIQIMIVDYDADKNKPAT